MNPDKDFSMSENLIDICFLAVTAYVRLPRSKWSRKIRQPCAVRVIVVSIAPDNTLLRRLFALLKRIVRCLAKARQQNFGFINFARILLFLSGKIATILGNQIHLSEKWCLAFRVFLLAWQETILVCWNIGLFFFVLGHQLGRHDTPSNLLNWIEKLIEFNQPWKHCI